MTVSTGAFMAQSYGLVKALGNKSVNSDAMFVIDGYEQLRLLIKQFPWPVLSPGDAVEIATPMGGTAGQPSQVKTFLEGQVQIYETVRGDVDAFTRSILAQGGVFNASVYEGTMERYSRGVKIVNAWLTFDPVDRDWENRTQATVISGSLKYHYFGEAIPGNI